MAQDIVIGGRLHSAATGNTVAGANEILDDAKGKKQNVINQEVDNEIGSDSDAGTIKGRIKNLETAVGSGGSVDERIAETKAEIIGDAAADYNTLGKVEDKIQETKSEILGDAASDYNTLGKVEDKIQAETSRAEAAEGALDNAKADKATTLEGYGITDAYTKSETYNKTEVNGLVDTPHQNYVTVLTYAALIAIDPGSTDTIYRVSNYDGSVPQVDVTKYSEYAWDGTQYVFLCVKSQIDEVFDISVYNNNATYADLAAALGTDGANVPQTLRRGGMSVKFVHSVDNKYVQYRLTTQNFSITISDWEEDESILQLKCLGVFPDSATRVCRSISTNNLVCSIILEDFLIYAKNELNGYPWEEFRVAGNEYTLRNINAIVANTTNNTVSVENLEFTTNLYNAVQGSDKVLLFINLLGKLYSPIPSLQNELEYLYHTEGYEASVNSQLGSIESEIDLIKSQFAVGNGIVNGDIFNTKIFKSIERDYLTVTITVDSFNIFGTYKIPNWQQFNNGTFTIPNVNALIADIDTNSLLVAVMNDATFHQYMTNKRYVAICINYLGRLYSAIPSVQYELDMFYEKEKEKNPYYEHTVVVASSDGDYTRVRDAVNAITDASEYNRYKILVKNGTYNEIDIETKDFVDIIGESRDGVVLVCDGLSSSLAPNGYGRPMWEEWLEDYSGQPISSIPKAYKHLFIHMSNSKISDLTMIVNNVKYAVHQDGNGRSYEALIENCDIIRRETYDNEIPSSLVGVGAVGGQHQKYVNCNFYMEVADAVVDDYYCAILWHNWNNQGAQCSAVLDGCNIYGCNVAKISELGSEQNDQIVIKNTVVDKPQYGIVYDLEEGYYKIDGQVVTDPTLVPYCIQVDVVSSNINYIVCSNDRLDAYNHSINDSNTIELERINGGSIGQPITTSHIFGIIGATIATDNNFVFTATSPNSKYYVKANKGAIGLGLCVAGTYTSGDDMYISNGKFTNVQNGSKVGVCLESVTIQNDGLVRIQRT